MKKCGWASWFYAWLLRVESYCEFTVSSYVKSRRLSITAIPPIFQCIFPFFHSVPEVHFLRDGHSPVIYCQCLGQLCLYNNHQPSSNIVVPNTRLFKRTKKWDNWLYNFICTFIMQVTFASDSNVILQIHIYYLLMALTLRENWKSQRYGYISF